VAFYSTPFQPYSFKFYRLQWKSFHYNSHFYWSLKNQTPLQKLLSIVFNWEASLSRSCKRIFLEFDHLRMYFIVVYIRRMNNSYLVHFQASAQKMNRTKILKTLHLNHIHQRNLIPQKWLTKLWSHSQAFVQENSWIKHED